MKSNPCINCKEHCCIGDYATFVTFQDVKRIAEFTKKKPDEFAKYGDICQEKEGQEELMLEKTHSYFEYSDTGKVLQLKSKPNGECIFLEEKRCSVYQARPLICRIFPIGFRREADGVKVFIEEEDRYCPVTCDGSLNKILGFLDMSGAEASSLINQFLGEIDFYKKNVKVLETKNLNSFISNLKI